MFTTKLNFVAPLAFAVLCVRLPRSSPHSRTLCLFRLLSLALALPLWRFSPADTGSFASFAGAVRERNYWGTLKMFTTKLNLVAHLALAVLCVAASIEPALAG